MGGKHVGQGGDKCECRAALITRRRIDLGQTRAYRLCESRTLGGKTRGVTCNNRYNLYPSNKVH